MPCPLCQADEDVIYACGDFYVIDARDPDYPGYVRIVSARHVKEMTDLGEEEAASVLMALWTAEKAVRGVFSPDKVNLAEFGNMVPHLHWHVIPRFQDDAHFPNSIWGERLREPDPSSLEERRALAKVYFRALKDALAAQFG